MRVWTSLAYGPENADHPVSEIVRITARQYDGQGRLSKITAVLPDHQGGVTTYDDVDFELEDLQVTELIYDTGSTNCAEGAEILNTAGEIITCNNGFIAEVRFPDPVGGQPDMADRIAFQYNSDGSLATRTDQRGVIFSHTYDDLGRKTETQIDDSIWFPWFPTVPENRIRKITYQYEPTGEPSLIIIQARPLVTEQLAKDADFLFEILDDGAWVPIHPSRHRDDQDVPWVPMHGGDWSPQNSAREGDP